MTDLPSAYSPGRSCFTSGKRRKIIMECKFLGSLIKHIIYDLLIQLGAKGNCRKRLCLSPCKECRTVCCGKSIDFTDNLPYLIRLSSVETNMIIENKPSGSFLEYIVVISFYKSLINGIFIGVLFQEFRNNGIKSILPVVLVG